MTLQELLQKNDFSDSRIIIIEAASGDILSRNYDVNNDDMLFGCEIANTVICRNVDTKENIVMVTIYTC